MNDKQNTNPSPGITVAEVLYIIFRHKWKIVIIAGVGIIATAVLWFVMPRSYQSEAKLFVKYVVETKSPGQTGMNDPKFTSEQGAAVINTEVEILTSLDLAQQVADTIGPAKILAKEGGGTKREEAAGLIHKNLIPTISGGGKVIVVTFKHKDPEIAQAVLTQVIQAYTKRHEEVHLHPGEFDEFLTQQTDQLRSRLLATEDELKRAKTNAGIISLDDSKKAYSEQITKIQEAIRDAEADLAERRAASTEMEKLMANVLHAKPVIPSKDPVATNDVVVSPEKVAEYKKICSRLQALEKREQQLLLTFTTESSWVKDVEEQISASEKIKQKLEDANPGLLLTHVAETKETVTAADPGLAMRATLVTETAKSVALQSKITFLTEELAKIRKQAGTLDDAEGSITDLQRKRNLQEKNYEYFAANLEQSKIDQALGAGRAYNISVIQQPSPPTFAAGSKRQKILGGLLFGSIAGAFGIAFLIELFLNHTVKRPGEIEQKVGLPLFVSIPRLELGAKSPLSKKEVSLLAERGHDSPAADGNGNGSVAITNGKQRGGKFKNGSADSTTTEIVPWDPRHLLRPFCEALRDGIITFFDVNNLTHKPKLVAVTGCSAGAGVSTIAASLAASLSETGDGNVLLVDMNERQGGVVHQFYKGDLACNLDEALQLEKRDSALVQGNLYVATETANDSQVPVILPNRFKTLLPRLRASDYDYIIFDMPAISQTSPTQRLARFMDMVVMVVESEKTGMQAAKKASSLLRASKTNVCAVMNKSMTYVPNWLSQES